MPLWAHQTSFYFAAFHPREYEEIFIILKPQPIMSRWNRSVDTAEGEIKEDSNT